MRKQDVSIQCSDGVVLTGTLYCPNKNVQKAILIVQQRVLEGNFTTHFSTYLAQEGFGVLTFDNRGIGDSLTGSVAESEADLIQWGRYDMSAAFEKLKEEFPNCAYYLVGHSAGGQLIGLMDNHDDFQAVFNVAASSGSLRNISGMFWWKARFFMSILIPLMNWIMGYTLLMGGNGRITTEVSCSTVSRMV